MANFSMSISRAPSARFGGSLTRLAKRNQAPRAIAARSAHVVRCMDGGNPWRTADVWAANSMVSDQNYTFVDIRADWEAEKYGRMDHWVNIPLAFMTDDGPMKNPQFLEMMQQRFPDPNTPLIIACDDGELRSEIAARDLCQKLGYTNVHVLQGGTDDFLEQFGGGNQGAAAAPAPVQAPSNTITISYSTGWNDCFVHFNVDDKGWTESPGWQMQQVGDVKQIVLEGSRMEFCINDGGDQWDAPPGNYNISEPGNYVIANGAAHKQ